MSFSGVIANCYDSHCHWAATGQVEQMVRLDGFKTADEVLKIDKDSVHRRDGWVTGFGWNENNWPGSELPDRKLLDQAFPDDLVAFSRADGHATWVNTNVLKELGWLDDDGKLKEPLPMISGGRIHVDEAGLPTGVLVDSAKALVDKLLPEVTAHQMNSFLVAGMKRFHKSGITHIRDMTCSELQWNEMLKLEGSGLLKLAVEQTFSASVPEKFDEAYDLAKRAMKVKTKYIRPLAMKVYYDGALGSEGAFLSDPYLTGSGLGLKLLRESHLYEFFEKAWEIGLALAVHAIGDQAAANVVHVALDLWEQGKTGELHLEHAQMLKAETVEKIKGRPVKCFMQPCHWLSDKRWLKEKVPEHLWPGMFPWAALEQAEVEFFFGSDSPIEPPDLHLNHIAIDDASKAGIAPIDGDFMLYHSHPDKSWVNNCHSKFIDGGLEAMTFDGEPF